MLLPVGINKYVYIMFQNIQTLFPSMELSDYVNALKHICNGYGILDQ